MNAMKSMKYILPMLAGATLGACGQSGSSSPTGFKVAVAPLTLDGVTDTCYRVTVTNGPDRTGDIVWQEDLCADQFGDGVGSLAYVGPCDADVTTDNSVTLELLDLKSGTTPTPIDDDEYANPCGEIADWAGDRTTLASGEDQYGPCTQNRACVENADVLVEFNVTVMRRAHQGFFDIAVEFDDIFCSAKLDCKDELLHNAQGVRDATAVVAFACTAGENEETYLHVSDMFLTCVGSDLSSTPFIYQMSNSPAVGQHGPVRSLGASAPGVFDWATYQGDEDLTSNGQPLEKCYYNRSIGLDLASFEALGFSSCSLSGIATATDTATGLTALSAAGTSYPIIRWSVPVFTAANPTNGTAASLCGPNPLNGAGSGVTTEYVTTSTNPATLLPITHTMSCGADAIACNAGPIDGNAPAEVTATLDGAILTVQTGASVTTVPLPAGYTLAGCHVDGCCNQ